MAFENGMLKEQYNTREVVVYGHTRWWGPMSDWGCCQLS
jgi:hypothetical protein